jgi:transposase
MAKTRSQTGKVAIKKEEEEDCKPSLGLMNVHNTRSKIAKRKSPIINNRGLPAQQVKVEEDTDAKSLLQLLSRSSNSASRTRVSQEQINQLIHYIVNDNTSIREASRKANISHPTGFIYYNLYKNDPEKKIPVPRDQAPRIFTQEQIGNLIKHIDTDKMTLAEASAKANMFYSSGRYYYNKYLKDPNHNIPIPHFHQYYTQDQKNDLIGYIINDKMSILAASKKANMNTGAGYKYYHKNFKVQNPDIPAPSHIVTHKYYTQEQIKELISYIVDDKMSIFAASIKANICNNSAGKYYRQYLKDNNIKVPVKKTRKPYTQDQINELIGCIVDDKMSITAASKKANMSNETGRKYYHQYLKDRNIDGPIQNVITQEQISELIRYIVDDKMSIIAASKKANMSDNTARKYYRLYLKDQQGDGLA